MRVLRRVARLRTRDAGPRASAGQGRRARARERRCGLSAVQSPQGGHAAGRVFHAVSLGREQLHPSRPRRASSAEAAGATSRQPRLCCDTRRCLKPEDRTRYSVPGTWTGPRATRNSGSITARERPVTPRLVGAPGRRVRRLDPPTTASARDRPARLARWRSVGWLTRSHCRPCSHRSARNLSSSCRAIADPPSAPHQYIELASVPTDDTGACTSS